MKTIPLGQTGLQVSRLAYGCMRLDGETAKHAVMAAFDAGYTLFDHADIYGDGSCEALFGEVLRESPGIRDNILIQSKCGIRKDPTRYDFSPEYIVQSVEGSLNRLGIEQLDLFLLHRPDYLMHAAEVADAFAALKSAGKVTHFGVSNFSTSQFELLQSVVDEPLVTNQVEINLHNIDAFENGVLDLCQRLNITPQAWCPIAGVAYPAWGNTFTDVDDSRIRSELERQSATYGAQDWIIALAWLLRHPAMISPLIGSTRPSRIEAATTALDIDYTREDWYKLLEARQGKPVP